MNVLGQMKKLGKRTIEDFEEIYARHRAQLAQAGQNMVPWTFYLPMHMSLAADLPQPTKIRILGFDFDFVSFSSLLPRLTGEQAKIMTDPRLVEFYTGVRPDAPPTTLITATSRAAAWQEAWDELSTAFDALRGGLELTLHLYQRQSSSSLRFRRGSLSHPVWALATNPSGAAEWFYFATQPPVPPGLYHWSPEPLHLSLDIFTLLGKNIQVLRDRAEPPSTRYLIADCLRLYAQAMDANLRGERFLSFWQMAEAITCAEIVGGDTRHVANNLAWHAGRLKLKATGYKHTLTRLGKKRNRIAHSGTSDVNDDDINILKLSCEVALQWLIGASQHLKTRKALAEFYAQRQVDTSTLSARKAAISYVERLREPQHKERDSMWRHLLEIYEECLLNVGEPECLFKKTLIFEEGWLLRSVLKVWKTDPPPDSSLPFLPFPIDAKVYSEGQLFTPFKVRPKGDRTGDPKGETNTRIDGIAGNFSIREGTKAGIKLDPGCEYFAVFEAKMYSPIGKGVKNAPGYDQVSRTAACLIHALLEAGLAADCAAYIVVLYPEDSPDIQPQEYTKAHIRERIGQRLAEYKTAGGSTPELERFEAGWERVLERLAVEFRTWEDLLGEIGDGELDRFYDLCKQFNRK